MQIDKLAMPSFNTTLVGVFKGALDHYGIDVTAATAFGVSGHAFLMNVHEQLCPSGPYCWRRDPTDALVRNLGLHMIDLGFYSPQSSAEERASVEKVLRDTLDDGVPCSMCNLDNQIITGYDEDGFKIAQPWGPTIDSTPPKLSFGSWKEFGEKFHVNFYVLERITPCDRKTAVLDSLDYAVDLQRNPTTHSLEGYGVGPHAYANWINAAVEYGSDHGNWWNAMVWSECRQMASEYLGEIQREFEHVSDHASELREAYADISDSLRRLSDREMDPREKVVLLEKAKTREAEATDMTAILAIALRETSERSKPHE